MSSITSMRSRRKSDRIHLRRISKDDNDEDDSDTDATDEETSHSPTLNEEFLARFTIKQLHEIAPTIELPGSMWGVHRRPGGKIVFIHINDDMVVDKTVEFTKSCIPNVKVNGAPLNLPEIKSKSHLECLLRGVDAIDKSTKISPDNKKRKGVQPVPERRSKRKLLTTDENKIFTSKGRTPHKNETIGLLMTDENKVITPKGRTPHKNETISFKESTPYRSNTLKERSFKERKTDKTSRMLERIQPSNIVKPPGDFIEQDESRIKFRTKEHVKSFVPSTKKEEINSYVPGSSCIVESCSNNHIETKLSGLKISYYRFPTDEKLLKKWILKCKVEDGKSLKSARICSEHFRNEDFDGALTPGSSIAKRQLKPNAVPSLYLKTKKLVPYLNTHSKSEMGKKNSSNKQSVSKPVENGDSFNKRESRLKESKFYGEKVFNSVKSIGRHEGSPEIVDPQIETIELSDSESSEESDAYEEVIQVRIIPCTPSLCSDESENEFDMKRKSRILKRSRPQIEENSDYEIETLEIILDSSDDLDEECNEIKRSITNTLGFKQKLPKQLTRESINTSINITQDKADVQGGIKPMSKLAPVARQTNNLQVGHNSNVDVNSKECETSGNDKSKIFQQDSLKDDLSNNIVQLTDNVSLVIENKLSDNHKNTQKPDVKLIKTSSNNEQNQSLSKLLLLKDKQPDKDTIIKIIEQKISENYEILNLNKKKINFKVDIPKKNVNIVQQIINQPKIEKIAIPPLKSHRNILLGDISRTSCSNVSRKVDSNVRDKLPKLISVNTAKPPQKLKVVESVNSPEKKPLSVSEQSDQATATKTMLFKNERGKIHFTKLQLIDKEKVEERISIENCEKEQINENKSISKNTEIIIPKNAEVMDSCETVLELKNSEAEIENYSKDKEISLDTNMFKKLKRKSSDNIEFVSSEDIIIEGTLEEINEGSKEKSGETNDCRMYEIEFEKSGSSPMDVDEDNHVLIICKSEDEETQSDTANTELDNAIKEHGYSLDANPREEGMQLYEEQGQFIKLSDLKGCNFDLKSEKPNNAHIENDGKTECKTIVEKKCEQINSYEFANPKLIEKQNKQPMVTNIINRKIVLNKTVNNSLKTSVVLKTKPKLNIPVQQLVLKQDDKNEIIDMDKDSSFDESKIGKALKENTNKIVDNSIKTSIALNSIPKLKIPVQQFVLTQDNIKNEIIDIAKDDSFDKAKVGKELEDTNKTVENSIKTSIAMNAKPKIKIPVQQFVLKQDNIKNEIIDMSKDDSFDEAKVGKALLENTNKTVENLIKTSVGLNTKPKLKIPVQQFLLTQDNEKSEIIDIAKDDSFDEAKVGKALLETLFTSTSSENLFEQSDDIVKQNEIHDLLGMVQAQSSDTGNEINYNCPKVIVLNNLNDPDAQPVQWDLVNQAEPEKPVDSNIYFIPSEDDVGHSSQSVVREQSFDDGNQYLSMECLEVEIINNDQGNQLKYETMDFKQDLM